MMDWLPWLPLAATSCHIVEEFVWPGGFTDWYRQYRANASRMGVRFLVVVNLALLAVCVNYGFVSNTRLGATALLGVCALLCSNGLWHAWASVKSHTVSPGVVTGILLFVPLMILEFNVFLEARRVSLRGAIVAGCVGFSYHAWAAIYYRLGTKQRVDA